MNVDRALRQERTLGVGAEGTSSQVMLFLCAFCLLLPSCPASWNEVNISCIEVRLSAWPSTGHIICPTIITSLICGASWASFRISKEYMGRVGRLPFGEWEEFRKKVASIFERIWSFLISFEHLTSAGIIFILAWRIGTFSRLGHFDSLLVPYVHSCWCDTNESKSEVPYICVYVGFQLYLVFGRQGCLAKHDSGLEAWWQYDTSLAVSIRLLISFSWWCLLGKRNPKIIIGRFQGDRIWVGRFCSTLFFAHFTRQNHLSDAWWGLHAKPNWVPN